MSIRAIRLLVKLPRNMLARPHLQSRSFSDVASKGNGGEEEDSVPLMISPERKVFEEYFNRPGPWDDPELNSLITANKAWAKRMVRLHPEYFNEIKRGHAPKILWIGCCDARVPANEIIGEPPGSVFVHRNIANQVINTDFNCMSVLQYAVEILKVKHIIVCGHYDCGGVKASMEPSDPSGPLENWLRNIRDVYRIHRRELSILGDNRMKQKRLVELNAIEQCVNIFKSASVQRRRVETHKMIGQEGSNVKFVEPRIHALVYEPTTGEATHLKVNFSDYLKDLRSIYNMYQSDSTPSS